ncbi:hypothetical protein [Ignatzschineria cameli]|uniref:hypothetical protein n=1 Tax=Ignatzschineria cameli TaxID=2182793 RepID=UPI001057DD24|nr:hypothetical protein [Ignatzschineria cameli]
MSCRRLQLHASKNRMPASIATLTINHLEIKSHCVAGPHYRSLPEVARRQRALSNNLKSLFVDLFSMPDINHFDDDLSI